MFIGTAIRVLWNGFKFFSANYVIGKALKFCADRTFYNIYGDKYYIKKELTRAINAEVHHSRYSLPIYIIGYLFLSPVQWISGLVGNILGKEYDGYNLSNDPTEFKDLTVAENYILRESEKKLGSIFKTYKEYADFKNELKDIYRLYPHKAKIDFSEMQKRVIDNLDALSDSKEVKKTDIMPKLNNNTIDIDKDVLSFNERIDIVNQKLNEIITQENSEWLRGSLKPVLEFIPTMVHMHK